MIAERPTIRLRRRHLTRPVNNSSNNNINNNAAATSSGSTGALFSAPIEPGYDFFTPKYLQRRDEHVASIVNGCSRRQQQLPPMISIV